MIEYYADKNLNKKLHSQGLHIIQSPVGSYVKPAGKSRKITRSITDTDEYFITTYFVLPTIIIMIITGIIILLFLIILFSFKSLILYNNNPRII